MSEQEKYDELIRQKFAEKEFLFNEENWEKAEKMLDVSKKSKKIFWWGSIFVIGLITGVCIMFLFTKGHPPTQELVTDQSTQLKSIEKNHSSLSSGTTEENVLKKNETDDLTIKRETESPSPAPDKNENHSGTTSEILNNDDHQSSQPSSPLLSKKNIPATGNFKNASTQRKEKKQNGIGWSTTDDEEPISFEENTSGNSISDKNKSLPAASHKKIKKNKINEATSNEDTQMALTEKKLMASHTTKQKIKEKKREPKEISSALAKKDIQKKDLDKKGTTITDSSEQAEIKDSVMLQEMDKKQLVVGDSLPDSVKQEIKKPGADSIPQKADSVLKKELLQPLPMDGLASVTLLTIDAGAHAQLGWKYGDTMEARGVTPIIGIGVTHYFNQKLSFCSGIQYGSVAYLKASSKKFSSTTYSFGSTTTETIIKPGVLNYLVIPLAIQYHFNERDAVFAGGNFSFLLNKKNKIELNYSHVVSVGLTESNDKTTGNYYANSFNPLDAAACIGYRKKIISHFTITAIANIGLLDIKKNSFFSQNKFERNSGLKLVLSYAIFDF